MAVTSYCEPVSSALVILQSGVKREEVLGHTWNSVGDLRSGTPNLEKKQTIAIALVKMSCLLYPQIVK